MKDKIFIGLTEIAGYYSNLKKGFQELDIECTFVDLSHHPFQYTGADENFIFIKLYKLFQKQMSKYSLKIVKAPFYILSQLFKIPIFIWALYNYNVFIFGFGRSFFWNFDLPILKLFNKKIIFVFNGSDGRPPYIDGAKHNLTIHDYKTLSRKIKSNIVAIERYADWIVTHPPYAHFHCKKTIKGLLIGLPFDTHKLNGCEKEQYGTKEKQQIKILHSPSDPIAKGTSHIRAAISDLVEKGYSIDFVEITGRPHKEVIKELQFCDFVIDQVYSDTPLAGFATEAAFFGKPAVVGGYYADYIDFDFSVDDIPPSLFCHPEKMRDEILRLIVDKNYRERMGKEAQNFVRTRWTPEQVAKRYLQLIEGTIPEEFIFDPNTIQYTQGGGIPESKSKAIIRDMIEQYGIGSLCLSDKPELEQRFREYAYDIHK